MRRINLGLALTIIACGGQSLDVGRDPGRGGSGPGGARSGVPLAGKGGGAGTDLGPASGGTTGGSGGVGSGASGGTVAATGGTDLGAAGADPSEGSGGSGRGGTPAHGAAGAGGTLTNSFDQAQWGPPPVCDTDESLQGLVGIWEGAVEDFYLQPVLQIRIEITGVTDHSLCGSVVWGTKAAPPPPTDPDAPYPSADTFPPGSFGGGGTPGNSAKPIEGFPYTIWQGAARSGTVRFSTWRNEPWRGWCALQPVYALDAGNYACVPGNGYGWSSDMPDVCRVTYTDGTEELLPVMRCSCSQLCSCGASGCTSHNQEPTDFDLTLSASGDVLSGPYTGGYPAQSGAAYRLTRAK